jgi:hypothetical protein
MNENNPLQKKKQNLGSNSFNEIHLMNWRGEVNS